MMRNRKLTLHCNGGVLTLVVVVGGLGARGGKGLALTLGRRTKGLRDRRVRRPWSYWCWLRCSARESLESAEAGLREGREMCGGWKG